MSRPRSTVAWAIGALVLLGAVAAQGQPQPPATTDIGVNEKLGGSVPAELAFRDQHGRAVRLGDLIDGQKPVVLVLAYVRCEALCSLVLRGVADAVRASELDLARDYLVVTVSIDPRETAKDSAGLRAALVDLAGKRGGSAGWHYLTGDEPAIRALADAVGFRYQWDQRTEQYAHPAVATVLDSDGRISQYLYGIRFTGEQFDAALTAAAQGRTETSLGEARPLSCFRFDPALRAHWTAVARYFAIGGVVLIVLVGGGIVFLARKERRRS